MNIRYRLCFDIYGEARSTSLTNDIRDIVTAEYGEAGMTTLSNVVYSMKTAYAATRSRLLQDAKRAKEILNTESTARNYARQKARIDLNLNKAPVKDSRDNEIEKNNLRKTERSRTFIIEEGGIAKVLQCQSLMWIWVKLLVKPLKQPKQWPKMQPKDK
ncbi:MAG: hypothetical protein R3A45_01130 [Bdellovibrionota bacterium]